MEWKSQNTTNSPNRLTINAINTQADLWFINIYYSLDLNIERVLSYYNLLLKKYTYFESSQSLDFLDINNTLFEPSNGGGDFAEVI